MTYFRSQITTQSTHYQDNKNFYTKLTQKLKTLHQKSHEQGLFDPKDKFIKQGKLVPRKRIELLLDEDSPFLELMPLAGLEQKTMSLGGSIIVGIGRVCGKQCMIFANLANLKGGALNQISVQKSSRLDTIAQENKLPVIYLVESAGADLSQQALIFNYGGSVFREITRRSKSGLPSISIVFGSSTAGGAYIPGMSDYVIMVHKKAKTYLAGPPLVKMAIEEDCDDESLGGALMHSEKSGLCDFLVNSEEEALFKARELIESFTNFKKIKDKSFKPPHYEINEIEGIIPKNPKEPYDVREIICRLVDDSKFLEFKPLYGKTLVTCWTKIFGHDVGILANNGVLFSSSSEKGAHFIQLCSQRKIPLIFLQNITGFMVGKDAETQGIIKNGAKLINAVSNCELPSITFLIGSSYGAGNYGMCGRAYKPRFLFSWPNSKLAVMGPEQLTGVLKILQKSKEKLLTEDQKEKQKEQLTHLLKKVEQEQSSYYGTSRLWDDGIIDPKDTRKVAGLCLSIINHQVNITQTENFGIFRM